MKTFWVLIPPSVMADQELGDGEKLLCGVINGLTRERGYCFASNEYLAKYTGKSGRTISRSLSTLQSRGHIAIDEKTSKRRKIVLTAPHLSFNHDKNGDATTTKMATDGKSDIRKDIRKADIREVFSFWVIERKKRMSLRGPNPKLDEARRKAVNARLKDGYTVEQIKEAITGCLASDFNVKGGYTDLKLICRPGKIDQYRQWHASGGRPKTETDGREDWRDAPPEPKEWQ